MSTRRDPRIFLVVIVLLILINSPPDSQPIPYNSGSLREQLINDEWSALGILNTTSYRDFDPPANKWLNLTGLRETDDYAWDLLDPVQQLAKVRVERVLGDAADSALNGRPQQDRNVFIPPLYRNISGSVQGEWARSSLSRIRHPSDMNISAIVPDYLFPQAGFERNLTGTDGSVILHLSEVEGEARTDQNRTASEIHARMGIGDDKSIGSWWEFVLNGVHFPNSGFIVLTTTSEKFKGIFALPHFTISDYLFSLSQHLLNTTLAETIEKQSKFNLPTYPWTSLPFGSSDVMVQAQIPRCEYIIFLQTHPVEFYRQLAEPPNMDWIEHEMRFPTGYHLPRRSPLTMSMVGFSPDCGFVFESKGPPDYSPAEYSDLLGSKKEDYVEWARKCILAFGMALTAQLLLLVRQMKETATPSTRNRVSSVTTAMFAAGDGFAFLSVLFLHVVVSSISLVLYATCFLALFSVLLELRFLMDIWTVQATEQLRQERQSGASRSPDPATRPRRSEDGLPLPVTSGPGVNTRSPTPPIIIPSDQDDPLPDLDDTTTTGGGTTPTTPQRAELGALYTKYCGFLFVLFFLTLHSSSWPPLLRTIYNNTISFLYLSFWIPQIYRNIMRNCRKALGWDFVLGQSALRLLPIAYFYAVPDNILFSQPHTRSLLMLGGWVWVQILALKSQEVLGPRFFVREGWAPPAYDYHPILYADEEGNTMPIGPISSPTEEAEETGSFRKAGETKGKGKKVFDCSICATDIEVPVVERGTAAEGSGIGGLLLTRRAYMVTPCRHIFHTGCLEGWMRYRLMCPNCREVLPPL